MLGIHSSLNSHRIEVDTDTDFVAAKILNGNHNMVIGALYRPTNNDQAYTDSLTQAIEDFCIANRNDALWIGGGINLPDVNWATDQVVGHQYKKSVNEANLQMMARVGLD